MLSVSLLGAPVVTLDGRPLAISRRKSRALLYFVAAHAGPVSRDRLLAVLWPDLERPAAQQTLRTTLHGLRKALGESLQVDDSAVALLPEAQVDARSFEQALDIQTAPYHQLMAALERYRGDFLDGFSLPEPPEFDDWLAVTREHYRRLAVRGYAALGRHYEAGKHYAQALEALDRALAIDPLQEDLQRSAIRLHYLAGDRAAAIRRYDSLRRMLDDEMGVPPMAETRAVYDAIITERLDPPPEAQAPVAAGRPGPAPQDATPPATPPPNTQLPFSGREAELAALGALAGSRRLGLIEGEPGIGKTRLAEEFIQSFGGLALAGAAHELEEALPYHPIIDALRSLVARPDWLNLRAAARHTLAPVWLAEVARLLPELDPDAPAVPLAVETVAHGATARADESRLWEGLHQFLLALATQQPVVLFIDDLHWADQATLALLGYLLRQPPGAVIYLAAMRPALPRTPLAGLLQALTREDRLVRLPLARLSREELAQVLAGVCRGHAEEFGDWLMQSSEGNPYVLVELFRHARNSGWLSPEGQVELDLLQRSPVVPQTIYSLTQSRLGRLSDPARRVLDAAVTVGREFDFDVVYRAAGLSETAALDAIDELLASGLVRAVESPTGTGPPARGAHYTFDHSITMEVAFREVGEARHRLMHRRVAEALEAVHRHSRSESVAGLIASHYGQGGDPASAAPYALRAGRHAAGLAAWNEAGEFFELALSADLDDLTRYEVLMELGEARTRNSEASRAAEAYRAALALVPAESLPAQLTRLDLARAHLLQARLTDAIAEVQSALPVNASVAARIELMWGAALSIEGADLGGAASHLRHGEAILGQSGTPEDLPWLAQIKFELGSVAAQKGDLPEAVALYREALDIAEEAPAEIAVIQRILANNNLAYHLLLSGDPSAESFATSGLKLSKDHGVLPMQAFLYSTLGEIALATGDVATAEQRFTLGLALAERLDMPDRIAGLTANLGLVARARGQIELAVHRLSTALQQADSVGLRHLAAQIRLWLAPLLPAAEARSLAAEARAFAESSGRKRLLGELARLESSLELPPAEPSSPVPGAPRIDSPQPTPGT